MWRQWKFVVVGCTLLSEWYHALPHAAKQDARTRSSVVRPIAMCSPSWRFFKRTRWAFHGRATPDFEPGRGLVYRPITSLARWNALVNHRSSCSRLLPRFLAAVERFLGPVCARSRHGKSFELRPVSRRNVYTRARLAFIAWFCCRLVQVTAKDRPYCPHVGHLFNPA